MQHHPLSSHLVEKKTTFEGILPLTQEAFEGRKPLSINSQQNPFPKA
jgi:hypothetical protein